MMDIKTKRVVINVRNMKGCENMAYIPTEVKELIHEYMTKYGKRPAPFNYDEWDNFKEYKEYLKKELNK